MIHNSSQNLQVSLILLWVLIIALDYIETEIILEADKCW